MNWIALIVTLLKIATVLVCFLLVFVVLLQRPKNEGLGAAFGGDTASNLFGAQTTNVLATLTRWLGAIFLGLCLLIAYLGTKDKETQATVHKYIKDAAAVVEAQKKEELTRKEAADEAAKVQKQIQDAMNKAANPSAAPAVPSATPAIEAPKPAEPPKAPEAPKTNETSKPAEAPKAPEAPKTDEAPKPAETPKTPEAPKTNETSKPAEAPKAPEAPKADDAPKPAEPAKP